MTQQKAQKGGNAFLHDDVARFIVDAVAEQGNFIASVGKLHQSRIPERGAAQRIGMGRIVHTQVYIAGKLHAGQRTGKFGQRIGQAGLPVLHGVPEFFIAPEGGMRLTARTAAFVVENDQSGSAAIQSVDFAFQHEAASAFLYHGGNIVFQRHELQHVGLMRGKVLQA